MRTFGIIGGLGPEATVDYYKEIIGRVNILNGDGSLNYPEIIIYSVNMANFIDFLEKGDHKGAASYIVECVSKLKDAGADFAAISANTPHLLFNNIQDNSPIPLISIVETCKIHAQKIGLKRCGLIGSKFTMKHSFFSKVFDTANITVISPEEKDIERIHKLLFTELELGIFKESTKVEILDMIQKMIDNYGIDSLILGCTEFPIMFRENEYLGIPFLNTTRIHVDAIVEEGLE